MMKNKETLEDGFCNNCNNDVCCCIIRTQETLEEVTEIWLDKYSERFDITKSRHLPFSFSNRNELEKLINEVLTWQKEISKENMWESYKAANTIFIDKIALRKEFELWFENFNKK